MKKNQFLPAGFPKGILKKECQICGGKTAFQSHQILKGRGFMFCVEHMDNCPEKEKVCLTK